MTDNPDSQLPDGKKQTRFHRPSIHLFPVFGSDAFGRRAETFARFFGTPTFLVAQTAIVGIWIVLNAAGVVKFDLYPFILLNLAFSLQAAYAAPLILLAQTRQADRDKATSETDALHREELANMAIERQAESNERLQLLQELILQNTELTETTRQLSLRIEALNTEIRAHLTEGKQ